LAKKGGQMADYHDSGNEGARGIGLQRMVRIAGAVSSVALVASLGMWGYKIAVRDVMGIPVVRALEGAMRVAPAAPGGTVTAHQGLAVNDVAALGVATPLPDSLTLAPRAVELAADDAAGLVVDDTLLTASAGLDDPATLVLPQASPEAVALAMADVGGEASARPSPVEVDVAAPGPVPEDAIAAAVAEAAAEVTVVAPATATLRPRQRPDDLVMVAVAAPTAPAAPAPTAAVVTDTQDVSAVAPPELDPATLAVGTPLVQLGAFDTAEDARAEWAKLMGRFPDLAGHAVVVQSATSGGQTFYRLRGADFASDDAARKFCTTLVAANAPCIPVAHR
jgi:hypothetical protein